MSSTWKDKTNYAKDDFLGNLKTAQLADGHLVVKCKIGVYLRLLTLGGKLAIFGIFIGAFFMFESLFTKSYHGNHSFYQNSVVAK